MATSEVEPRAGHNGVAYRTGRQPEFGKLFNWGPTISESESEGGELGDIKLSLSIHLSDS